MTIIDWIDVPIRPGGSPTAKGLRSRWKANEELSGTRIRLNIYDDHADCWWFPTGTSSEALSEPNQQFTRLEFDAGTQDNLIKLMAINWIWNSFGVRLTMRYTHVGIRPIRVHPKTKDVMREIGMFEYPADMDDFLLTGEVQPDDVRVTENPAVPDGVAIPAEMISEWDELTETQRLLAECQRQNVLLNQENVQLRKGVGRLEEINDHFQDTLDRNTKVRASVGERYFTQMLEQMVEFMRARFDVLQRRDQELKDRDGKAQAVLAEQIQDFEQYRDGALARAWREGWYSRENYVAKVKDWLGAGDIDDPPTEPKNPYQLDQRKEQDHG